MSHIAIVRVVKGVVTVDVDPLEPQDQPATLEWHLKTEGWSFTAKGIDIERNTGQFSKPLRTNKDTSFTWDDANNDGQKYKYTINVQQGDQLLSLDPIIINK